MSSFSVSALSPLDGRYAAKLTPLRGLMSEQGFMHRRVQVEITWLLALSDAGLPSFKPFSTDARRFLRDLVARFGTEDALAIKAIEQTTNHDVKAVEYWLKAQCQRGDLSEALKKELGASLEFIHFACTSEDINNTSHALQLKAARGQVLLPGLQDVANKLRDMAHAYAMQPMLSRTNGQTASPTTVGKEMANIAVRLHKARQRIAAVELLAKMNGAVGNYNAHLSAWPEVDWEAFSRQVIEAPASTDADAAQIGLGLVFQPYSIQIEPHDYMAELFDAVARADTVLIASLINGFVYKIFGAPEIAAPVSPWPSTAATRRAPRNGMDKVRTTVYSAPAHNT